MNSRSTWRITGHPDHIVRPGLSNSKHTKRWLRAELGGVFSQRVGHKGGESEASLGYIENFGMKNISQ